MIFLTALLASIVWAFIALMASVKFFDVLLNKWLWKWKTEKYFLFSYVYVVFTIIAIIVPFEFVCFSAEYLIKISQ